MNEDQARLIANLRAAAEAVEGLDLRDPEDRAVLAALAGVVAAAFADALEARTDLQVVGRDDRV